VEIFSCLGLLCFSGVNVAVPCSRSRCVHLIVHASPALAPVSLMNWRYVAVFGVVPAISSSTSRSSGMNGSVSVRVYFGGLKFSWNCWANLA